MISIRGETMSEIYPKILETIYMQGRDVVTRGKGVREIENMSFTLLDPMQPMVLQESRKISYAYAIIEALSLFMPGAAVADMLVYFCPNMENFRNQETKLFDGSYAQRLTMYDQLRYCYSVLKEDPNTRRAVLDFYNAAHDQHESRDIACTLNLLFRIRDDKLNVTLFMRGNDILWGTPYNFAMFTLLQNVMAHWLGIPVGTYEHVAGSAHYYLDKEQEVIDVIDYPSKLRKDHPLAVMPAWDLDVEQTFSQVDLFFQMVRDYIKGGVVLEDMQCENSDLPDEEDLPEFTNDAIYAYGGMLLPAGDGEVGVLEHFWFKVIKPFIDKRLTN